jgi:hypothetical protein
MRFPARSPSLFGQVKTSIYSYKGSYSAQKCKASAAIKAEEYKKEGKDPNFFEFMLSAAA